MLVPSLDSRSWHRIVKANIAIFICTRPRPYPRHHLGGHSRICRSVNPTLTVVSFFSFYSCCLLRSLHDFTWTNLVSSVYWGHDSSWDRAERTRQVRVEERYLTAALASKLWCQGSADGTGGRSREDGGGESSSNLTLHSPELLGCYSRIQATDVG